MVLFKFSQAVRDEQGAVSYQFNYFAGEELQTFSKTAEQIQSALFILNATPNPMATAVANQRHEYGKALAAKPVAEQAVQPEAPALQLAS